MELKRNTRDYCWVPTVMFLFSLWCFECFSFWNGNSEAFFWFMRVSRAYLSETCRFWYLIEPIAKLFWAIVIVLGQMRLLLATYGFAFYIVNLWKEITLYGHQTVFKVHMMKVQNKYFCNSGFSFYCVLICSDTFYTICQVDAYPLCGQELKL